VSQEKVFQVRNNPNVQFWEVSQEEQEQLVNICGWEGRVLFTSPGAATTAVQASAPQQHAQAALSDEQIRTNLIRAATSCGHSIDSDKVILYRENFVQGNALAQLAERLLEAHKAASQQPAAAPAKPEHVAVSEGGVLRWMTGRKIMDCELYTAAPAVQVLDERDMFLHGVIAALGALAPHHQHGGVVHDEIVQSVGKEALYRAAEPEDVAWAALDPEYYAAIHKQKGQ